MLFCSFQPQLIRSQEIYCDVLIYRQEMLGSFLQKREEYVLNHRIPSVKVLETVGLWSKTSLSRVLQEQLALLSLNY